MAIGGRYDIEAVRRAAQEAKRKARIKAIVSNCTAGVVLIAFAIGAKIGWDKWQEHKEEERRAEAAAAARAEYERQIAEKRRVEEEARRKAQREAEKREREAEAERIRKEREDRIREREEARMRQEAEREAARQREKEDREWQEQHKSFAERTVASLRFAVNDYIAVDAEFEQGVETYVDGDRWTDLAAKAGTNTVIEFLDTVNDGSVTNAYSESRYPDRATLSAILELLDKEKFIMVVRLNKDRMPRQTRLALVAADVDAGLAVPPGAREMKDSAGRVDGWTAPFVFKKGWPMFVMPQADVDRFNRDWRSIKKRIMRDAAKLDDKDAFVAARLKSEMDGSVNALKVELATIRQKLDEPAKDGGVKRSQGLKDSVKLRGSNGNIRSFR